MLLNFLFQKKIFKCMQDLPKLHKNYSSGAIIKGSFHPTEENILLLRNIDIYTSGVCVVLVHFSSVQRGEFRLLTNTHRVGKTKARFQCGKTKSCVRNYCPWNKRCEKLYKYNLFNLCTVMILSTDLVILLHFGDTGDIFFFSVACIQFEICVLLPLKHSCHPLFLLLCVLFSLSSASSVFFLYLDSEVSFCFPERCVSLFVSLMLIVLGSCFSPFSSVFSISWCVLSLLRLPWLVPLFCPGLVWLVSSFHILFSLHPPLLCLF